VLDILIKHQSSIDKSVLPQWIDAKTDEGFTALHFASF